MALSLELSPELSAYAAAVRTWAVQEVRPFARQADTDHALPDNWAKILDTCPVPLGRPGDPDDALPTFAEGPGVVYYLLFEALAYGDVWLVESLNVGIAHHVVEALGTPEQVERWYRPIVDHGGKTGFGMSEPGVGSDTSNVQTTATRDGDSWVINGSKMYCSLGADAEYIVVFATTDKSRGRDAVKAFVVERDTPGVHVLRRNESKLGLRCWVTSQLAFDHCVIPAGNLLGWSPGQDADASQRGMAAGLSRLNFNRPNVAGMGVGIAEAALDVTTDLLGHRRHEVDAARWTVVEAELDRMRSALQRSRLLNLRAKFLEDQGVDNRLESSIAKAYGPPTAEKIIRRCMQLLGPEGASTDLLLEKWYRDIKIVDIFEGSGQIMRVIAGRALMGREAGS